LIAKYGARRLWDMAQSKYLQAGGAAAGTSAMPAQCSQRPQASNERISLIFFTRPSASTVVACLPSCVSFAVFAQFHDKNRSID
jgi:hypothetical protein